MDAVQGWEFAAAGAFPTAVLDALPYGCTYIEGGVLLAANPAFYRLTGLTPQTLIGSRAPFPYWRAQDSASNFAVLDRVLDEGRAQIVEVMIVGSDGTDRYVEATVDVLRDQDGRMRGHVTVWRDISEQRAEHVALTQARHDLAEAQEQSELGSWTASLRPGGELADAEVSASQHLRVLADGAGQDLTRVADLLDLVQPADRPAFEQALREVVADGGARELDHQFRRPTPLATRHVRTAFRRETTGSPAGAADQSAAEQGAAEQGVVVRGFCQDVTAEVLSRRELAASEQQFRLTFDTSPIGIALVSLDGSWTRVNDSLCEMVGYSQTELLASSFQAITHPDDLDSDLQLLADLEAGRIPKYQLDKRYLAKDGSLVWVSLHVSMVRMPDGRPSHFVAQIVDITERHRFEAELTDLATTDPLTRLANRRVWESELETLMEKVGEGVNVFVGILDIDHFKMFNDTHGHLLGDELLKQTAVAWTRALREDHARAPLARLGGEEFAFAITGVELDAARRMSLRLTDLVSHGQHASCGLTLAVTGDDRTSVMSRADAALYSAKRAGRHRVDVLLPA